MINCYILNELRILHTTIKIYRKFLTIWRAISRKGKENYSERLVKELEHLDFFRNIHITIVDFNNKIRGDRCKLKLFSLILFANSLIIQYIKQAKQFFLTENPRYRFRNNILAF